MRKTKINIQFDSDIKNEKVVSDMGEYEYLKKCEEIMEAMFLRYFNMNEEGMEFNVKVEITEE